MKQWIIFLADGSKDLMNDEEMQKFLKKSEESNTFELAGVEIMSAVSEDCDRAFLETDLPKSMLSDRKLGY